jgi:hypothetical protein
VWGLFFVKEKESVFPVRKGGKHFPFGKRVVLSLVGVSQSLANIEKWGNCFQENGFHETNKASLVF